MMNRRHMARIRQFYEENRQGLFSYALSLTRRRAAAEDAVHTAFQKLLASDRFPDDLKPYVFRSVRNAAVDAWRKDERQGESLLELSILNGRAHEAGRYQELELRLKSLADDERETIVLKVFDDLTFKEITLRPARRRSMKFLPRIPPPARSCSSLPRIDLSKMADRPKPKG